MAKHGKNCHARYETHQGLLSCGAIYIARRPRYRELLGVSSAFLAIALACKRFLRPLLFTRFQVEGVSFDLLDNVFLLDLALKAA
jgi:hypothetical protein